MVMRGFSTGVVGRSVGLAMGIHPLIMAEHSTGRIDPDPKKRPIERLFGRWTDGVIAVAKGQIPFLVEDKGFAENRIRVIYNGIDPDQWQPGPRNPAVLAEFSIPPAAPVVGILAMLRPEKDHETFLGAAKIVHQNLPDAHFLIVGDGPERQRLETLARNLGLEAAVHFTGERVDISDLLTVFDVSVLCSVTIETFPMAFLEAMAMERPLVATDLGGLAEMIDDGENGFLVPMRDPQALAAAIVGVVTDRQTNRAMGQRSRQIVEERFTVGRMIRETEDYLDSFFS
jgi:glycosyltransferase involved in cell wall biosynthesis